MKHLKKLIAAALTMFVALAVSTVALAADDGSITITNAAVGSKYSVYKLFDATVGTNGKIAYSLPANKVVENDTVFNKYFQIENGNVVKKDALTDAALKTEEFQNWAKGFGTIVGSEVTANSSTLTFSNLPYGYYYISSTVGGVVSIDSTNPAASVIDKNETVTFDKDIVLADNSKVKANEAGLNIPVSFDITVNTKNYDGDQKVFKYVVNDTMDAAFSLTTAPVVKVGNKTLTAGTDYTIAYTKANAATTTLTEADAFVITIPWTSDGTKAGNHLYDNADVLHVTYAAKLDPTKVDDLHTGVTPNKNTAEVNYYKGNDIPDGDTPSGKLGKKETETFNTALTITKTDGTQILTGAQFTLTSTNGTKVVLVTEHKYVEDEAGTYYKLDDGTYTDEAPNGNTTHDAVYDSTTTKYKMVTEAKVMGEGQTDTSVAAYVGEDGKVTFTGLGAGSYTIEETVVPAGYNKAADISFDVTFDAATKKFASSNTSINLNGTTGIFETTIVNNQGTELPSTGGIGTTIFYIVGGIMVVAAGVLLVTKKRVANN